jgi:hypothetical protein
VAIETLISSAISRYVFPSSTRRATFSRRR